MNRICLPILNIALKGDVNGYGPELHTFANAISDPNGNEADAITGWSEFGLNGTGANVFESQSSVKHTGSYALRTSATDTPTAGARIWWAPTLEDGATYFLYCWLRHIGDYAGAWRMWVDDGGGLDVVHDIQVGDLTFSKVEYEFTMSGTSCEIRFGESSGANAGGIYLDNLSLRKKL